MAEDGAVGRLAVAPHGVVVLRQGEQVGAAALGDRRAGEEASRHGAAERVGVEANLICCDAAAEGAAVAHGHEDGEVGDAGRDEHRNGDFAAIDRQLDEVRRLLAGLVARAEAEAELARRLGADHRSVVPGQLGDRVGKLLQPGIVGEAAVVGLVVECEDSLECCLGRRGRRG